MQRAPKSAGTLPDLVAEAEKLVASSPDDGVRLLRALLRRANPARRKVQALDGDRERKDVAAASAEELLAAIRLEAEEIHRRDPSHASPYKRAEKHFREPPSIGMGFKPGPDSGSPVRSVADAIAAGAIDFTAADSRVICLLAPAEVPALVDRLGPTSFAPHGGVYALTLPGFEGFYVMPGALVPSEAAYWVRRVCRDLVEPPNRRNIDAAADPDVSNLRLAATTAGVAGGGGARGGEPCAYADGGQAAAGGAEVAASVPVSSGRAPQAASAQPQVCTRLWERHRRQHGGEAAAAREDPLSCGLAWATLGLQYDWTARAYHLTGDPDFAEHQHLTTSPATHEGGPCYGAPQQQQRPVDRWSAPFPPDLHAMAADAVRALHEVSVAHVERLSMALRRQPCESGHYSTEATGVDDCDGGGLGASWGLPLSLDAQAGIVNVYHPGGGNKVPMGEDPAQAAPAPLPALSFPSHHQAVTATTWSVPSQRLSFPCHSAARPFSCSVAAQRGVTRTRCRCSFARVTSWC